MLRSQIPLARGMRPIRVGQIGVGHAHANKLAVYRASPDYEVVGVVEPDPLLPASKLKLRQPFATVIG
ncbi:MAG: hypothetical protein R3C56_29430 [Pirellulaceae bacterium]